MTAGEAFAPAKVNLWLHVGPVRADGFHPLSSLMVFADVGDRLRLEPSDRFELVVDGPFADHAPAGEDNLVSRAVGLVAEAAGRPANVKLVLTKQLPAGAGLGGGSSDAARALVLAAQALEWDVTSERLEAIGAQLGSDIPACIRARPVIAEGRGERLAAAPSWPELPAVLVWPGVGSATGPVYRAFDDGGAVGGAEGPVTPSAFRTLTETAAFLETCRNDLEAPAVLLQPEIGRALQALRAAPEALLVRMSGSGSACFALCPDAGSAKALAARLTADNRGWWVAACRLGGGLT